VLKIVNTKTNSVRVREVQITDEVLSKLIAKINKPEGNYTLIALYQV
jgi:hypothetical protein